MGKAAGCTIRFTAEGIILSGAAEAIHAQAEKILRRCAYSGRPYKIKTDTSERVVLGRQQETNGAIRLVHSVVRFSRRPGRSQRPL
ncbi:MAG: hypothetical protein ACYSVY_00600 [Planctomycetota bacterium]|jgi:hypothetical protein